MWLLEEDNEKSWNFTVKPIFFLQSKVGAYTARMYCSLEPKWLLGNMADANDIAALQGRNLMSLFSLDTLW